MLNDFSVVATDGTDAIQESLVSAPVSSYGVWALGECCKAPPEGSGAEPQPSTHFYEF